MLCTTDVVVVRAALLKDYLRELPDPLCTSSLYQMLIDALSVRASDDDVGNAQLMFSILDCLPAVNQVYTAHLPTKSRRHLANDRLLISLYKKLSYRRVTARCVLSVVILPITTQQCRNYLYDKS